MRKNGNNDLNRGTKKRFVSFLPIIGASLLAGGALAGSGVAIWQVSKKYEQSSDFTNTISARVMIDPVAFEDGTGEKQSKTNAEANAKLAAERLSGWLKECGNESYDVSYELSHKMLKPEGYKEDQWFAYLTAKFNIQKITSKITTEEKKIDDDPFLSIFNSKGFNSNNKTFVYRWYREDEGNQIEYTIKNQADLFDMPETMKKSESSDTKVMNDKDGKPGIIYKVTNQTFFHELYNDALRYKDASKKDAKLEPRLYIINDFEGMINEASYHLSNWVANKDDPNYISIYRNSEYSKFAEEYYKNDGGTPRSYLGSADVKDSKESSPTSVGCLDVLNCIDSKTPGTIQYPTIFSKHIEDTITAANIYDTTKFFRENIDDKNYKNTLPKKDGEDIKINYFWHSYSTKNAGTTYLKHIIERSWKKSKIVKLELNTSSSPAQRFEEFKESYKTTKLDPKFTKTLFGTGNLIGVLSIGFLIYLVILGIILGALYRTTGVFSWICLMFALSMTALIAIIGSGYVISMALMFGLLGMSVIGFMSAMGICGRMKRRLALNEDTRTIVSKTFGKSVWPVADISIIALIFGICFLYIAPLGLNPLGLTLIVGAFANFISVFLLNGLFHVMWFNNSVTMGHYGWFGKHSNIANQALMQGNSQVPSTFDATKLEFANYSRISKAKTKVTNRATWITLAVLLALLIAGIVVFCIYGIAKPNMYHTSNCLVIQLSDTTKGLDVESLVKAAGIDFTQSIKSTDGNVWYFYCSNIPETAIASLRGAFGDTNVWSQWLIGSTNQDLLTSAILSILIASSIVTVYAGIRCHWTAFVPMIAATFALPILTLGISTIAKIQFDEVIILGYIITTLITEAFCANVLASINATWDRKEGYSVAELKFIVDTAIKNDAFVYIMIAVATQLMAISFTITAPYGTWWISLVLGIGSIVTFAFGPMVMAWLLCQFLIVRNKALIRRNKRRLNKTIVNYDTIDEQAIEGINKFSKRIAIPKEEPKIVDPVKEAATNEQK